MTVAAPKANSETVRITVLSGCITDVFDLP
jgi:hypothetical protein